MTRIAIVGAGAVARTLAGPLEAAGHVVALGSPPVDDADVVVNALPGDVSVEVLARLPFAPGTVLVDVANAVHTGPDGFATGLRYPDSSLAEELAAALPDVRVVKTLNTMHVSLMARRVATAFLSGDDPDAKAVTRALLGDLGRTPDQIVDLGGLSTARWAEAFALAIRPAIEVLGPVPFGLAVVPG